MNALTTADRDDLDPMVDYIVEATAQWWSYLSGLTPEFCRERFGSDVARRMIGEVYAYNVDNGATDEVAVSAAGVVAVRATIAAVSDEQARELSGELLMHARNSVREG